MEALSGYIEWLAGWYSRRLPWRYREEERRELRQEAWLGALLACGTWRVDRGPLDAWQRLKARSAVLTWIYVNARKRMRLVALMPELTLARIKRLADRC